MTCTPCEERRAALRAAQVDADALARAAFRTAAPAKVSPGDALLRYLLALPIKVRGLASGREYQFDGQRTVQNVDRRDVDALLESRIFRRVA
jgi:hypothetical protein